MQNKHKQELKIAAQAALDGDWDTAHNIAQNYADSTANWLHAVLHKIEGDVSNSHYWYARTAGFGLNAKKYTDFSNPQDELMAILHDLDAP